MRSIRANPTGRRSGRKTRDLKTVRKPHLLLGALGLLVGVLVPLMGATSASAAFQGAIYTTEADCTTVNANIYDNKQDVYLNGGPQNQNSAGLPTDTPFYVKITDHSGATLLSKTDGTNTITSDGAGNLPCTQLWGLLHKESDGAQGYDDTPNNGTEYKVWVSTEADFPNDDAKTDNFKVAVEDPPAKLTVSKDATPSVQCDFCGSLRPAWSYPVGIGSRRHATTAATPSKRMTGRRLDRAVLIPVPRTLPDRYAPRFRERAKALHLAFLEQRTGPPQRLSA